MVHHLTLEKAHIDGPNFFKIYIADLFQNTFGQT